MIMTCLQPQTWAVRQYLRYGVPPWKINLGITTQARSFTLKNTSDHLTGSPVTGHGTAGTITQRQGTLSYPEVGQLGYIISVLCVDLCLLLPMTCGDTYQYISISTI